MMHGCMFHSPLNTSSTSGNHRAWGKCLTRPKGMENLAAKKVKKVATEQEIGFGTIQF